MGILDSLSGSFDGQAALQTTIDSASGASDWFTPVVDTVAGGFTAAFNYIDNNEWAANALAGAAGAGLSYLGQKDIQKRQEKIYRMREDREDNRFFVGGSAGMGSYGSLTNGLLTNGNKRV